MMYGKTMVKKAALGTAMGLLISLTVVLFGVQVAVGAEPVKIACSAQAYEVLKGHPLEILKQKTGLELEFDVTTSAEAVDRLLYGMSDLAFSAQGLDYRLSASDFKAFPFCKDPLIVISNNRNDVENMTLEQVRAVFSKRITNAKELGGRDQTLIVVSPSEKTALYLNFMRMFMGDSKIAFDIMTTQSTFVGQFVRRVEGAITFINQSATNPHLGRPAATNIIKIDGLGPEDDAYPFYEVFSLVIKGELQPAARSLLETLRSPEFCEAVTAKCLKTVE